MSIIDEPPPGWVPEMPVDPEEIPGELRALEEQAPELAPEDDLALLLEAEERDRLFANQQVDGLDSQQVLEEAWLAQRAVNLAQARQLFLAAHWADLYAVLDKPELPGRGRQTLIQPGGDGTPELLEFAPAELGVIMELTPVSARLLISDALDLRHRLPRLWHRLQTGTLKSWVVRRIASQTRHLTRRAAALVDARLCQVAGRITGGRLDAALDDAIKKADPVQADADAAAARDRRGVWLGREIDNGDATLVAKGPAPDLRALDVSLDEVARALTVLGDDDTHDQRRVKAMALLADPEAALETIRRANEVLTVTEQGLGHAGPHDGSDPRRRPCDLGRAVLYVHVTDRTVADALAGAAGGVARVRDVGPVLMRQVCGWLGHRQVVVKPVLDIPGIKPVDRYEFTDQMAEALRIVSPAGFFPYSTNVTGSGDSEHPKPYVPIDDGGPPGQTGLHNGAWTPRFPHRIKTHGGWTVRQLRPGAWLWQTPHSYYFLVDEHGTTPVGRLSTRSTNAPPRGPSSNGRAPRTPRTV